MSVAEGRWVDPPEEALRASAAFVLPEDQAIDHPSRNAFLPLTPLSPSLLKWLQLLLCWALALGLSALLVWSGRHWPVPLLHQAWAQRQPAVPVALALVLVLLPPLLMAMLLLVRWPGVSTPTGENRSTERMETH
ncbi:MAG: hypothetical protein RLZZ137_1396 [Cyanobacteriota bacterium]|jgi:hypothetical protein